ncbi:MAG: putative membrane protein [Bacteroidia bacterium]|jgi:putative membrane protein
MFVKKNYGIKRLLQFSWMHLIWLTLWGSLVLVLHNIFHDTFWISIPWLPISVIGTAVAFYVGFKNNSAYDRLWEARKIWGGIVNTSRMWGSVSKSYVGNTFRKENASDSVLYEETRTLIHRQIAWLYTLREQLLKPTPWEHISSENKHMRRYAKLRRKGAIGQFDSEKIEELVKPLVKNGEGQLVCHAPNSATKLIDLQSQHLKRLRDEGFIDDFRHMEMQSLLNEFYTLQGKCERIKNYPLPRQYASISFYFVGIFIFLLPFGMLPLFDQMGHHLVWLSVPFTTLIGWVFVMMELVGDYSENPFEGLPNDIPMLSLCRTIEIDLRAMLDETDLPPKIEAVEGVLM